ncbi:hypothetical protein MAK34_004218 [Klebsiella pneumoniae]
MTSKFSIDNRELLQRISSGEAVVGIDFGNLIVRELAAFRMAVMDSSESVELPLDYLQGHKDGLEWASQLAEANHPETGDWLYDDPIELAKAIRKGPDMPPVQPVADSEPVAEITEDLGHLFVKIHYPTTLRAGDKLYLHAQRAKTVQPVMFIDGDISSEDADKLAKVIREFNEEDERPLAKMARIIRENPHPTNECDMPKALPAQPAPELKPAPVVPDGYVMVPMRLTAENGAKGALSGEFSETKFVNCPECFGDDECETCDGSGRIEITVPVTWTTIKDIWAKGVEHFAAAPQEVGDA